MNFLIAFETLDDWLVEIETLGGCLSRFQPQYCWVPEPVQLQPGHQSHCEIVGAGTQASATSNFKKLESLPKTTETRCGTDQDCIS